MTNWSSQHKRIYDEIDYFDKEHIEGVGIMKPRKRNWNHIIIVLGVAILLLGILIKIL